jgi:hypothetical protein
VSTAKAQSLLGYRDAMPAREAIAESARWWLEHGSAATASMIPRDRFDYAAEDRVHASLEALGMAFAPPAAGDVPFHSYPHPTQASTGRDAHGR